MNWLRWPVELRQPDVFLLPGAPSALDNASLLRKRAALAEFYRFHAARGSAQPVLGGMTSGTRRATGDFIPMLAHTMSGPVERSPLRIVAGRKRPKDLTDDQVSSLQDACLRLRDRFLVARGPTWRELLTRVRSITCKTQSSELGPDKHTK